MGEGSIMRSAFGSRARESDSEEELFSEEQEASLLTLLLCLRLRDFERPLPLLLLDDLLLDDPRDEEDDSWLFFEEDDVLDPTGDSNFLPATDAGDLGGR